MPIIFCRNNRNEFPSLLPKLVQLLNDALIDFFIRQIVER